MKYLYIITKQGNVMVHVHRLHRQQVTLREYFYNVIMNSIVCQLTKCSAADKQYFVSVKSIHHLKTEYEKQTFSLKV